MNHEFSPSTPPIENLNPDLSIIIAFFARNSVVSVVFRNLQINITNFGIRLCCGR